MSFSFFARQDNSTANNPALNLTTAPAVELTFVTNSPNGDLTLEANGGSIDNTTLVEINGNSYNVIFEFSGALPTQKNDGSQQVPDQFEGDTVFVITVLDYPSVGTSTRFAFLPNSDATASEMNDFGNGGIGVQNVNDPPPPEAVCFCKGTYIATPDGDRLVEELKPGDTVLTASENAAKILWISHSHHSYRDLVKLPGLRPICVPRGWVKRNVPYRDLWISPNHRIVIRGIDVELHLGLEAVLAPAKHLFGKPNQPGSEWFDGVKYYHLLLENHDLVLSNGLESESFFPGKEALKMLDISSREGLSRILEYHQIEPGQKNKMALPVATRIEAKILKLALDKEVMEEI